MMCALVGVRYLQRMPHVESLKIDRRCRKCDLIEFERDPDLCDEINALAPIDDLDVVGHAFDP